MGKRRNNKNGGGVFNENVMKKILNAMLASASLLVIASNANAEQSLIDTLIDGVSA